MKIGNHIKLPEDDLECIAVMQEEMTKEEIIDRYIYKIHEIKEIITNIVILSFLAGILLTVFVALIITYF